MDLKSSQCPVLFSICDHKDTLIQSIQPIEAIRSADDLLATIVENCGYIFPEGRPSHDNIRIEFRYHDQLEIRKTVAGLKRLMDEKQQEYANPSNFKDILRITIRFSRLLIESSKVDFEFSSPITSHGTKFKQEVDDLLQSRDKYTLNIAPTILTTMLATYSPGGRQSQLNLVQNMLSDQLERNRELHMKLENQESWAEARHREIHTYAERLEEEGGQLREEMEETTDRLEEKIDDLIEENKRLEGFEVQAAEIDEKLRKLTAKARGGKIDAAALSAIRKTIL